MPKFLDFDDAFHAYWEREDMAEYGYTKNILTMGNEPTLDVIRFDKTTGYTYIRGEAQPMRGSRYQAKTKDATQAKRAILVLVETFKELNWFEKIIYIIGFTQYWKNTINLMHWQLTEVITNPKYCQPVRELHRVLTKIGIRNKLVDIACGILDSDPAYLYRVQDVLTESIKTNKPLQEFIRLTDMLIAREQVGGGFYKYRRLIRLFTIYLRFNIRLQKKIGEFLKELDVEEIKLSKEDWYWANYNKEYNFGNIPADTRMSNYLAEKNEYNKKYN